MPTLTRLILIALVIGFTIYGAMLGLVMLVRPVTVELSVDIPQSEVELKPWPYE